MAISAKDAVQKFKVELLQELPLDEPLFFAIAERAGLFPLGIDKAIKGKETRAHKVDHFLDHVIEPGADDYLPKLLQVMRESKVANVMRLADDIQAAMGPVSKKRIRDENSDGAQPQLQLSHQTTAQSVSMKADQSLIKSVDIYGSEDNSTINFEEYDNVSSAFATLFSIFQKVIGDVNDDDFQIIRNACISQTDEPLCSLLQEATNSHCLFRVLATNKKYCNWIRIRILEIIAYVKPNSNKQLVDLVKNYKKVIYSKTLDKIWSSLPHYPIREKYYTELKATFDNKDPDKLTVEELFQMTPNLAREIEMLIAVVQEK